MNMPKGTSITFFERERISFLRMKKKKTWIAEKLGRDYSVIKREIQDSSPHLPYVAIRAEAYAEKTKKIPTKRLEKWQNEKLKKVCRKRTPEGTFTGADSRPVENISSENLSSCTDTSISYESIYDYIYRGKEGSADGTNICDENRSGDDQSSLENREKRRFRIEYPFTKDPRSLPSVHTLETGKPIP
ncbi:MAG: hypothetical protein IPL87_00285 [Candidatus Moraniibacteriota bacterium]|nr:MAG: hypothetical protein IPL87_00285 [Candidatus Moranbacteria bacterium]